MSKKVTVSLLTAFLFASSSAYAAFDVDRPELGDLSDAYNGTTRPKEEPKAQEWEEDMSKRFKDRAVAGRMVCEVLTNLYDQLCLHDQEGKYPWLPQVLNFLGAKVNKWKQFQEMFEVLKGQEQIEIPEGQMQGLPKKTGEYAELMRQGTNVQNSDDVRKKHLDEANQKAFLKYLSYYSLHQALSTLEKDDTPEVVPSVYWPMIERMVQRALGQQYAHFLEGVSTKINTDSVSRVTGESFHDKFCGPTCSTVCSWYDPAKRGNGSYCDLALTRAPFAVLWGKELLYGAGDDLKTIKPIQKSEQVIFEDNKDDLTSLEPVPFIQKKMEKWRKRISPEFAFDMGITDLVGDLRKKTTLGAFDLNEVQKELEREVKGERGKPNWKLALHQLEASFFTLAHKENIPPKKEGQTNSSFQKPSVITELFIESSHNWAEDIITFVFRKTKQKPKVHQQNWEQRFQASKFEDKEKMLRKALTKAVSYANLHHDVNYDAEGQKRPDLNVIPEVLRPFTTLSIPEGQKLENLFGHQALKWLKRLQAAGKEKMTYPSLKDQEVDSLNSFTGYNLLNLHVFRDEPLKIEHAPLDSHSKESKQEVELPTSDSNPKEEKEERK